MDYSTQSIPPQNPNMQPMQTRNVWTPKLIAIIVIALVVLIGVGGAIYFYVQKTKSVGQQQQNINIASTNSCADFTEFSDYVLKNIVTPDSKDVMQMNPYVITSFRWKQNSDKPFVSYPIINGILAEYNVVVQDKQTQEWSTIHDDTFIKSSVKKDSDFLSQNINAEASNLELVANQLNTISFESSPNQEFYTFLRTFSFVKGEDIYSVVLKAETSHQAPGQGSVTITCGQALDQYNKVYNALNFKSDSTVQNPYDNDYIAISDVSPDKTVYALTGSNNHIKIANYYYFDGNTAKLVSSESYPANCSTLESQKVGQGMRCVDVPSYNQRTVTYENQIPQDSKHVSVHIEPLEYDTLCGEMIWPAIRNTHDENVVSKVTQILSFKNITRITKQDYCGSFEGSDYQVNYDKNNVLSISFATDWMGAYPSETNINYVINLLNGEVIKLSDVFYQNKLSDLVNFLNAKLQANIQQEKDFARQQNPSGQDSQCSEETVNQGLQSGKGYDPNYGKFTEQNLIASNNLNGETPQYTSLKITSTGIEFIYDFGFAHAIQACEPNGVVVLTYDQLKNYIRLDGLLGNEVK